MTDRCFNESAETMSRDELTALQNARLRKIVAYAMEHNAFFRDHFASAGIHSPSDFNGLADLNKLPFMSKEDFRREYPLEMCCTEKCNVAEVHMSTGSTGTPVAMPYTLNDLDQWAECMARCYVMAGAVKGDFCQITPAFGLFNGGFGCYHGARRLGLNIVPTGSMSMTRQIKLARDFGTRVITGIASSAVRLMEHLEMSRSSLPDLKIGMFGAETFSESLKKRISSTLGIEAFDIYGMTETGGIGTLGMDCRDHSGIHPWEDQYVIEIIDPATGKVLPDGEPGELTVTSLTREALPVIRFRTGDLTRIVSREKCACGRTHLRLDPIYGRRDDMLIVSGVNFFPKQVEQLLLGIPGVLPEYQLVIQTRRDIRYLLVKVEADPCVTPFTVKKLLKEELGFSLDCEILAPGSLPRQDGKAKRVFYENSDKCNTETEIRK